MGKETEKRKSMESEENAAKKRKLEEQKDDENNGVQQEEITTSSLNATETLQDSRKPSIKICSWNVAGLKAWVKKDGLKYLKDEDADIVCLQETKCLERDLPGEVLSMKKGGKLMKKNDSDYHMHFYSAEKKGYSGVALWSKIKPIEVKFGVGQKEHDNEGRLITAEYEKFFVVTSYVPNSGKKLVRLDYRREWNNAIKEYLGKLKERKPVVFCGDLNVAHQEIDIANPKANKRNAGFTVEERDDFTTLLGDGYIDSYRHLNPDMTASYTFWTYMANARAKNVGWRLDYFVISKSLESHLCNSEIRSKIMGSDHCPIVLTLDL